jgi:hypothetical protein
LIISDKSVDAILLIRDLRRSSFGVFFLLLFIETILKRGVERGTFAEVSKEVRREENSLHDSHSHRGHLPHEPIVQ